MPSILKGCAHYWIFRKESLKKSFCLFSGDHAFLKKPTTQKHKGGGGCFFGRWCLALLLSFCFLYLLKRLFIWNTAVHSSDVKQSHIRKGQQENGTRVSAWEGDVVKTKVRVFLLLFHHSTYHLFCAVWKNSFTYSFRTQNHKSLFLVQVQDIIEKHPHVKEKNKCVCVCV